MAEITHEINLCGDCVLIVANAATSEDTGSPTTDEAAERLAENWPGANIVISDEGGEDFSSRPCDGCDQDLAGARTPAVVFS